MKKFTELLSEGKKETIKVKDLEGLKKAVEAEKKNNEKSMSTSFPTRDLRSIMNVIDKKGNVTFPSEYSELKVLKKLMKRYKIT